jgi:hypothetical protein
MDDGEEARTALNEQGTALNSASWTSTDKEARAARAARFFSHAACAAASSASAS